MIASGDDDLDIGAGFAGPVEKRIELPDGGSGWIRQVEHIATDEQHIHRFLLQRLHQPVQKLLVLVGAVVFVEELTQVPIGGVEDVH